MSLNEKTPPVARISRRTFLSLSAAAGSGLVLAACGAAQPATSATSAPAVATSAPAAATTGATTAAALPPAPAPGPLTAADAGGLEKLIEAAKAEGALSVIALPDSWANYGEVKKRFLELYPFIKLEDLNPDGSSAQEIEAIKANAGGKGPQAPDVLDVGFTWGDEAKAAGLLQPYKVATWDSIPEALKDAEGYWYVDYYGTMAFEVNTQVVQNVPQDWADLLKPEYKGQIALSGDPTSAAQPIYAVWAAALGNGGSLDDPMPGLEFFKRLNEAGNLLPITASPATVAKGETPITLRWDYNALANRDENAGNIEIAVVVPKSGSIAGPYVQAISAYAPRPNAARLWQEFLYSDEGQLLWLKGYATPARYEDLKARGVIPQELADKLPKTDAPVGFATAAQMNAAFEKIRTSWASVVGATIK